MADKGKIRYRYIMRDGEGPDEPICHFRLISACNMSKNANSCIRVRIPDDMVLEPDCNYYSTTEDTRTLGELGYDVLVKFNGKWKVRNDFRNDGNESRKLIVHALWKTHIPISGLGYITHGEYNERCRRMKEILGILHSTPGCVEVLPEYKGKYILYTFSSEEGVDYFVCKDFEDDVLREKNFMIRLGTDPESLHIIRPDKSRYDIYDYRPRYRHIADYDVDINACVRDYRLYGGNLKGASVCVRIRVTKDLNMRKKYSKNDHSYYVTDDERSIRDFEWDVVVKVNGKWRVRNDIKKMFSDSTDSIIPFVRRNMVDEGYHLDIGRGYVNK